MKSIMEVEKWLSAKTENVGIGTDPFSQQSCSALAFITSVFLLVHLFILPPNQHAQSAERKQTWWFD